MTVGPGRAASGPGRVGPAGGGLRPGEPGYGRLLAGVLAAGVAVFAPVYVPQPLLPQLAAALDVRPGAAVWAVSATTLGLAAGLLPAAWASDAVGRIPLVRWSLWTSALLGLACAAAPGWEALLALRVLQGVALAGVPVAAMAYLREEVDAAGHARAVGLYIAGTALGGMSGRLLAGVLADVADWRAAFVGVGVLALACATATRLLLPPARGFVARRVSPRAALAGVAATVRDPVLAALLGVAASLMGAFVAFYNALGFRLEAEPYGFGPTAVALVYLSYAAGSLGSAGAGGLADRVGRRPLFPVTVLVCGAGAALSAATSLPLVVAGTAVMTLGFFAAHSLASGWVAARAHATGGATAQASALYLVAYYTGATAPGALGPVAFLTGGWPRLLLLVGVLLGTALLLGVVLRRTRSVA